MTSRPCTSPTTKPRPSAAGRVTVCLTMRSGLKRPTRNVAQRRLRRSRLDAHMLSPPATARSALNAWAIAARPPKHARSITATACRVAMATRAPAPLQPASMDCTTWATTSGSGWTSRWAPAATLNDAPVVVRGGAARRRCVRTISKASPTRRPWSELAFVA